MNRAETTSASLPRRFVWILAMVAVLLGIAPELYGWLTTPAGFHYLGYQYNTDDQMVYAAWMRQAMDGHFFFDNRFTTDAQPGLTIHVYFFLLGLVAKVTGIVLATVLARIAFSILFVFLAARLIDRTPFPGFAAKMALVFTVFGGGLGFLAWQKFGVANQQISPTASFVGTLMSLGRPPNVVPGLPVDVWQPEGFVFPSMLTNSLFMVSLCLILISFEAFLESRDSWRPVIGGAVALGVLMNIHSYDTLMVGLVLAGFLGACAIKRQLTPQWTRRAVVIALGMLAPALWFVHVLRVDPVFQSRAATKTYSPYFRTEIFGYLPLIVFGLVGIAGIRDEYRRRRHIGLGIASLVMAALFVVDTAPEDGFYLGMPAFTIALVGMLAATALCASENLYANLLISWAFIGLVAIYFPGLFQRKLAMGLSVPWAILAGAGVASIVTRLNERSAGKADSSGRLVAALSSALVCATSLLWLVREVAFIQLNVSNTTRHPVYLTDDVVKIVDYLNRTPGKKVVLAVPGAWNPALDTNGRPIPDAFNSPALPDLAPIVTGLTGAYAYAGHWSETPEYQERLRRIQGFFIDRTPQSDPSVDSGRKEFARQLGANYAIVPAPGAFPNAPFVDPDRLGQIVLTGKQFDLVKLS